jgi:hypothetical protein
VVRLPGARVGGAAVRTGAGCVPVFLAWRLWPGANDEKAWVREGVGRGNARVKRAACWWCSGRNRKVL